MLSSNELSTLYEIISDENKTFESINNSLQESFKEKDFIKISTTLSILLKDNLLNISQRIISFYIIDIIQKKLNIEIHPFLPLILGTIQKTKNKSEQYFLLALLNNNITFISSTVKNFLQDNSKNDLNLYKNIFLTPKNALENSLKKNGNIRHVLYDRKKSDIKNIENHKNLKIDENINITKELNLNFFEPNLLSFSPEGNGNNNFIDPEPIWIMPGLKHKFLWQNDREKKDK